MTDEKLQQVEMAWTEHTEREAVLFVARKYPFRSDLPERERSRLKRLVADENLSLNYRESAALALGWLVEQNTRTSTNVMTHRRVRFTLYGYRDS